MAGNDKELKVILKMQNDMSREAAKAHQDLDKLTEKSGKANEGFGKMAGGLNKVGVAIAIVAAAAKVMDFAINKFKEQELQVAKLNAVLKSTGGISGMTKDSLGKLADEISNLAGIDDEAVTSAEAVMLTFTSIGKDVFPLAMNAAADMSAVMGDDLQSSVVQLGKALQDPVEGISALSRVGVNFNQSQKDTIKNLVESNRVMDAQKLILKELQVEFGGAAAAMGDTTKGSQQRFNNAVDDAIAELGQTFEEKLRPVRDGLTKIIRDNIENVGLMGRAFVTVFQSLGKMMANVGMWLLRPFTVLADYIIAVLTNAINTVANVLLDMLQSLPLVGDTVFGKFKPLPIKDLGWDDFMNRMGDMGKDMDGYANSFNKAWTDILNSLKKGVKETKEETKKAKKELETGDYYSGHAMGPGHGTTAMRQGIDDTTTNMLNSRETPANPMMDAFQNTELGGLVTGLKNIAETAMGGLTTLVTMFLAIDNVNNLLNPMTTILKAMFDVLTPVINNVLSPLVGILRVLGRVIGAILVPVIQLLTPIISAIAEGFAWLYNNAIMPFANAIIWAMNAVYNIVADVYNWIVGIIGGTKMTKKTEGQGYLQTLDLAALRAEGGGNQAEWTGAWGTNSSSTSSTGQGAQYTQGRNITVNIQYMDKVIVAGGATGLTDLAILIKGEIQRAEALGI